MSLSSRCCIDRGRSGWYHCLAVCYLTSHSKSLDDTSTFLVQALQYTCTSGRYPGDYQLFPMGFAYKSGIRLKYVTALFHPSCSHSYVVNKFSVCVPGFHCSKEDLLHYQYENGKKVYKSGVATGLTRGKITKFDEPFFLGRIH